jgi:hypothetical protein
MSILECASSPEDGANWNPPSIGEFIKSSNRRLREAAAFGKVANETRVFLERKAIKHGLDTNRGLAYFREANAYREAGPRLQEMFDQQSDQTQQQGTPPKSMAKVHKAAMKFHKRAAEKAGIDTNTGQAHFAAMNHHINAYKQAKAAHKASKQQDEAAFGHSSKQSPMPVPAKSQQPSEDIRQDKPAVPLKKLQQTHGAHAGMMRASAEGGPGSGPRRGSPHPNTVGIRGASSDVLHKIVSTGKGMRTNNIDIYPEHAENELDRRERAYKKASREAGSHGGPNTGMDCTLPPRMKKQTDDRIYRGKWPSTHESRRSLRRSIPIWESDSSERDRSASGLTA